MGSGRGHPVGLRRGERGQASLLLLAVMFVLIVGAMIPFAFGQALGSRGKRQRAADLAAISAGQVMRDLYPRLFEPPFLEGGIPNPRHLPLPCISRAPARRRCVERAATA